MTLRYKGKPDRGANLIADETPSLCLCKFVAVGKPLDGSACKTHDKPSYACDEDFCKCSDYRPNVVKTSPGHWPRCMCGHIAQMHN